VGEIVSFLLDQLSDHAWLRGTIGLERWSCTPNPAVFGAIERGLMERDVGVVDATATIRRVRRIKSTAEIATVERAQVACDAGLRELQRMATPGMTELQAWELYMRGVVAAGGEPAAIHETVAVGPPDASLHSLSSRRRIAPGDYFHADACAAVDRYHARATRPYVVGEPGPELVDFAKIAGGAGQVLVETAKVGMAFRDLHAVLRAYYLDAGLPDAMFFAGGYELGISFPPDWVGEFIWSIHDDETDDVIEAGLVTNFESCAFLAMVDTVVFEEGGARILSRMAPELLVIE
jgi:Xaa-Pro aminopeptidase